MYELTSEINSAPYPTAFNVRREISGVIEPLKADLATMNQKTNDLETSHTFLAEKYDTLLAGSRS